MRKKSILILFFAIILSGFASASSQELIYSGHTTDVLGPGWQDNALYVHFPGYDIISSGSSSSYIYTTGVDGCITVVIPLVDKNKAAMIHLHWNNQDTSTLINDAISALGEDIDGRTAFVLGGYNDGTSDNVYQTTNSLLQAKGMNVKTISEEFFGNKVITVVYDIESSTIYVPEDSSSYSVCQTQIDDVAYAYYQNTHCGIKTVNIDNGQEIYSYNPQGNILSEKYTNDPTYNNVDYTYYSNGNLKTMKKNGVEIVYSYDSQNRIVGETTIVDSTHIIPISYSYDSNGNLKEIRSPSRDVIYTYDPDGRLVEEKITTMINGQGLEEDYKYTYDSDGNVVSTSDNKGLEASYTYESVDYDCQKVQCTDTDCSDSSESCYTFYDCDSGACTPYECSAYTIVDSTCSYDRIKSREIGNYNTDVSYTAQGEVDKYCDNTGEECYTPKQVYDSNGLLTGDDFFTYAYANDNSLATVQSRTYEDTADFQYYSDGLPKKMVFSSPAGEYEQYTNRPDGEVVKTVYHYSTGTASVVSPGTIVSFLPLVNLFTGLVSLITGRQTEGEPGFADATFYATIPGDTSSFVSEQELADLMKSENLAPELKALLDDYNKMKEEQLKCVDYDANMTFDESLFVASYIEFNGSTYYDECMNASQVREGYCGLEINWQFWKAKRVARVEMRDCALGCANGACISPPSNVTIAVIPENITNITKLCSNGMQNPEINETGIDCGGQCSNQDCCANGYLDRNLNETGVDCGGACKSCLELPPTPVKPARV